MRASLSSFVFTIFIHLIVLFAISNVATCLDLSNQVIGAVNCGGHAFTGAHNIRYSADNAKVGIASDFGTKYAFKNAYPQDVQIYQTERWHSENFGYSFPVKQDGEYVIILKFSEVYFQRNREKVFDVSVNGVKVLEDFDIFSLTKGRGYAHDQYIPVSIKGNQITVLEEVRKYSGDISITFEKGLADNPKVNGIAIIRGKLDDMPNVPVAGIEEEEGDIEDDNEEDDRFDDIDKYSSMRNQGNDEEEYEAAAPVQEKEINSLEEKSDFRWITIIGTIAILIPVMYLLQKKT